MSIPRARLLDLMRARCELFGTTFNPEGIRTGNKILRQRLKGPALASYYPRKLVTLRDFRREFEPLQLEVDDEAEQDRLDHIAALVTFRRHSLRISQSNISQSESPWEGSTKKEEGSIRRWRCVHSVSLLYDGPR
ncbi:hypothetical protein VTJ49DRAFT_7085 [Mycothermus thermophilus]|uniref:Small ribosomal subunit protein mS33 n=1 Tax=Humicola insolens TaxID=85995 RepID=A0ABR3VI99_HUMIN